MVVAMVEVVAAVEATMAELMALAVEMEAVQVAGQTGVKTVEAAAGVVVGVARALETREWAVVAETA